MKVNLEKYTYKLPEDRIAKYQLPNRDESKLLVYKNGRISHHHFYDVVDQLPTDSLLVFNNTKVIQARLEFFKKSGGRIEIFCLEPENINQNISDILSKTQQATWKCMVGNRKKWKNEEVLVLAKENLKLEAYLKTQTEKGDFLIEFEWNQEIGFTEILEEFGKTPIPPYMKRKSENPDKINYQTVYAKKNGAVAAPTAGLHFTENVLNNLSSKNIKQEYLTLHVSAGTFQPIKAEKIEEHPMHEEQIVFTKQNIENLIHHKHKKISVGTTSLRALESLYWYGVMLEQNKNAVFDIPKLYPYDNKDQAISQEQSLMNILDMMNEKKLKDIYGKTSIFIFPGYDFKMVDALITNYHQPKSTLILLVVAFVGDDWEKIYNEALEKDYRFLSYGDSSLLFR
jgi:S-adenosylmethionine:tRNA ribosyltransferase-isomerase